MKRARVIFLNVGFWAVFALLNAIIFNFFISSSTKPITIEIINEMKIVFLFLVGIPAILSYFGFYFIVFRYYKAINNKGIKTAVVVLFLTLCISLISSLSFEFLISGSITWSRFESVTFAFVIFTSFLSIVVGVIAFIIRAFINWFDDQAIKEELQEKNHQMELALIKSQLDPHFLFNTLNNIDILIEAEPKKASKYLNELSDIMRFMLFETKSDKIELNQEVQFLEKYIELQKIRSYTSNYVTLKLDRDYNHQITPMLFIPFVENAFKHVSTTQENGAIEIQIISTQHEVKFRCTNKYNNSKKDEIESHKIGNELIQKRIKLNYPNNHELKITNDNNSYDVSLILKLDEN